MFCPCVYLAWLACVGLDSGELLASLCDVVGLLCSGHLRDSQVSSFCPERPNCMQWWLGSLTNGMVQSIREVRTT